MIRKKNSKKKRFQQKIFTDKWEIVKDEAQVQHFYTISRAKELSFSVDFAFIINLSPNIISRDISITEGENETKEEEKKTP